MPRLDAGKRRTIGNSLTAHGAGTERRCLRQSECQRDLREPVRRGRGRCRSAGRGARRRAGRGSPSSSGLSHSGTPGTSRIGAVPPARTSSRSAITSRRAPRSARPRIAVYHAVERGARRGDRDHRPAGRDRGDRAVHQVGGRVGLEQEARELADLERDLERGAVVDAARDDRAAGDLREVARARAASANDCASCAASRPGITLELAHARGRRRSTPRRGARSRRAS